MRQLQQALADLVVGLNLAESGAYRRGCPLRRLIRTLADQGQAASMESSPPKPTKSDETSGRAIKQAALAADALRQMVLEAVEAPPGVTASLPGR